MSDTADDVGFYGKQVLNKSKTSALRERMRAFADEHEPVDVPVLRDRLSGGTDVSTIVVDDRNERV